MRAPGSILQVTIIEGRNLFHLAAPKCPDEPQSMAFITLSIADSRFGETGRTTNPNMFRKTVFAAAPAITGKNVCCTLVIRLWLANSDG